MLDKKSPQAKPTKIAFNWERIKKQTQKRIDELKCNSPKISRREELEAIRKQTTRLVDCFKSGEATNTTDITINPDSTYDADGNPQTEVASKQSPKPQPGENNMQPDVCNNLYGTNNNNNDNRPNPNGTNPHQLHGTNNNRLLAPVASPKRGELQRREAEGREVISPEELGPDQNAIALLKRIKNNLITGKDLDQEERRLVVRSLRLAGQTQDSIAELLGVSRRTIVSDCKYLRQMAAMEIQQTDTTEIAGDVYQTAKQAIRKAMAAGHYKTVSTIMRDMVELLQSMGLVYRAPKTSMQANLNANMSSRKGYQKYIETIGNDKDKVVEVLDCMFDALSNDNV